MSQPDNQPSVHLFFGEDDLRMEFAANALVERAVPPEEAAFRLDTVDARVDTPDGAAQALKQCIHGLLTVGFFGNDKVVWLKSANFLPPAVLGRSEQVKTRLEELVQTIQNGLPPGLILLITASKAAKNSRLYKACAANGVTREFPAANTVSKAGEQRTRQTAADMFKHLGLQASAQVLAQFVDRVGGDTRQMYMEASKLATFLGERKEVRPEDVRDITCMAREAAAWEFSDAVADRDVARAFEILRRAQAQKDLPPIRLLYHLEYKIRDMLALCESIKRGWLRVSGNSAWPKLSWHLPPEGEELLAKLGDKNPLKLRGPAARAAGQAARFSLAELERWHARTRQAHERLVQTGLPPLLLLELLLFDLIGREAEASR